MPNREDFHERRCDPIHHPIATEHDLSDLSPPDLWDGSPEFRKLRQ